MGGRPQEDQGDWDHQSEGDDWWVWLEVKGY